MRRIVFLMLATAALLAVGFLAGKGYADRDARKDMAYATLGAALERTATIQLSLNLIEQQRTERLKQVLETRLASAIQAAHSAITTYGVPQPLVVPNLTESMRRAGQYLQHRGVEPEAVKQAEWVVARLTEAPAS